MQHSVDAGQTWQSSIDDSMIAATEYVMTNLVNGTEYLFRVAAVGAEGISEFVVLSAPVTPSKVAAPLPAPPQTPATGRLRPGVALLSGAAGAERLQSSVNARRDSIIISGSGARWKMASTTGLGYRQGTLGSALVIRAGGSIQLQGNQFLPNSIIKASLRRHGTDQEIPLGEMTMRHARKTEASIRVPSSTSIGRYVLILSGLSPNGQPQHIVMGARVMGESMVDWQVEGARAKGVVSLSGVAIGIPRGAYLRPWLRIAGESGFTQGLQRIDVSSTGGFTWQRKALRPLTVHLRTRDGVISPNIVLRR